MIFLSGKIWECGSVFPNQYLLYAVILKPNIFTKQLLKTLIWTNKNKLFFFNNKAFLLKYQKRLFRSQMYRAMIIVCFLLSFKTAMCFKLVTFRKFFLKTLHFSFLQRIHTPDNNCLAKKVCSQDRIPRVCHF